MRLLILIGAFILMTNSFCQAQGNTLHGKYLKKPVPYRYVREADVMWSNTIWRIIDLREKINLPLYYPTVKMDDRISLIDLLLWGIEKEGIVVYSPDEDDEFSKPMTWNEIENKFDVRNDTIYVEDPETGESVIKVIRKEMETSEVKKIMLKELWYFNKQSSQFEVRILGICPIREFVKEDSFSEGEKTEGDAEVVLRKLFWVDFTSARFLLSSNFVFNNNNDAERLSFDDIFFKRRFSSYIFKESNVYDNRSIVEYKQGLDAVLESQKINDNLFVFEHDLWEY